MYIKIYYKNVKNIKHKKCLDIMKCIIIYKTIHTYFVPKKFVFRRYNVTNLYTGYLLPGKTWKI